ncbi:MAG: hypothetical protein WCE52_08825, partial [Candidatus Acidiferrum sp.]
FGLSDLDELPSLKEFEALAREALGSDEGVVETSEASLSADSMTVIPESSSDQNFSATPPEENETTSAAQEVPSNSEPMHILAHLEEKLTEAEELREEEVSATGEGMPSGQLDEDPPSPDADGQGPKAGAKAAGD